MERDGRRRDDEKKRAAAAIQAEGRRAFESLPGFVRDALIGSAGSQVLLSTAGAYDHFPFGALRCGDDPKECLGLRHVLPRVAGITAKAIDDLGPREAGRGERRAVVMVDPTGTLEGPHEEARLLSEFLRSRGYCLFPDGRALADQEATTLGLCAALSSEVALVHYTGHGSVPRHITGQYGLQTGDEVLVLYDGPFGPSTLRDRDVQLTANPLVVLNSCLTGRTRLSGGEREDLAGTLLCRGAGGVVASSYPVSDSLGTSLGVKLHCSEASAAGEALLRARQHIADLCRQGTLDDSEWPGWPLFSYQGNPWLRLPHHRGNKGSQD